VHKRNLNEAQTKANENFIIRDLVKCSSNKTESRFYGHYVLEWFNEWSIESREKSLIDPLINDISNNDFSKFNPNIVWSYLIEHRNFKIIRLWCEKSFSNEVNSLKIEKKIDQEMIDFAYDKLKLTQEHHQFLNELAKLAF
jgi:hypothetical protein